MTISEEMKAQGWIEHDGGPCPVPLDSKPRVMWADGHITDADWITARKWQDGEDSWQHKGPRKHHIIAYRPEAPNA